MQLTGKLEMTGSRISDRLEDVSVLVEKSIDKFNVSLHPLTSFILPSGTPAAAWCHLARTVCRRAERDVAALMHIEEVNTQVLIYLNRLSDLLFVLARVANDNGKDDVLWVPAKNVK